MSNSKDDRREGVCGAGGLERFRGKISRARVCGLLLGLLLLASVATAQSGPTVARDPSHVPSSRDRSVGESTSDFLDHVHGRHPTRDHYPIGISFGAGTTPEKLADVRRALEHPEIRGHRNEGDYNDPNDDFFEGDYAGNPLMGRPFEDYELVAYGKRNPISEVGRLVTDHHGIHVLSDGDSPSPHDDIRGHSYDILICHSNGCATAFDRLRSGEIRARVVLALGTDMTSEAPFFINGAEVFCFLMPGDPVTRITFSELGNGGGRFEIKNEVPFDHLFEIPGGVLRLLANGTPISNDPHRIILNPPTGPGKNFSLARPFLRHGFFLYLQAIAAMPWDSLPRRVREVAVEAFGSPESDRLLGLRRDAVRERKSEPQLDRDADHHVGFDHEPEPPFGEGACRNCDGGDEKKPPPGPPPPPSDPPGPPAALPPPARSVGGISADVAIDAADFETIEEE